ncbi:hypothetical protein D9M72_330370 [compost metagenome]
MLTLYVPVPIPVPVPKLTILVLAVTPVPERICPDARMPDASAVTVITVPAIEAVTTVVP